MSRSHIAPFRTIKLYIPFRSTPAAQMGDLQGAA